MRAFLAIALLVACETWGIAQSSQSLGDVAREQAKNPPKSAKRVYSNEDLQTSVKPTKPIGTSSESSAAAKAGLEVPPDTAPKPTMADAAAMQSKIRAQKEKVVALQVRAKDLQDQIDSRHKFGNVSVSVVIGIIPGPGSCDFSEAASSHPYEEWCNAPAKWQGELDKVNEHLAIEAPKLEALQDEARKLGFGSAIYDPD